jgi:catalase
MAMQNPKGRVNYEPNSRGAAGGPRENPEIGFRSFPAEETGTKVRLRPESFADHYSQARQFYISQTPVEQKHIGAALIFELSKVEEPAIRERLVSHLPNIDPGLAEQVAAGLGLKGKIKATTPAVEVRSDLEKSKPLSIILNGPETFAGRKVGALVTDGVDAKLVAALRAGLEAEGAVLEVVAPTVGGVEMSDGKMLKADHKFGGGPSVLFDAVAILPAEDAVESLLPSAAVGDFIRDAFGHLKFIAYTAAAMPLFEKAGIADALDEGCLQLDRTSSIGAFVEACRKLRFWKREEAVSF